MGGKGDWKKATFVDITEKFMDARTGTLFNASMASIDNDSKMSS